MAVHHIIDALFDDWDRVNARLDEPLREELRGLATGMREAVTPRQRVGYANRIVRLLMTHLEDDRVLDADAGTSRFGNAHRSDPVGALALLATRFPETREHGRTVGERVLSAPWEAAHVLRERGVDPDLPDLIGLDRDDGSRAVPSFQFNEHGAPIPLVLRVNRLMGARRDPWGVADWWLSANAWLREIPSALIGRTADDLLFAAAVAAVEG